MQVMEKRVENNKAMISGAKVVRGYEYDHTTHGEDFYMIYVEAPRLSGVVDTIPVIVSDRIADVHSDIVGESVYIDGQFRSYNKWQEDGKRKLLLFVFANDICFESSYHDEDTYFHDINSVILDGCICKAPIYRETPLKKQICDVLLAVNRPYGKSDYIPCIVWGRDAKYVSRMDVGRKLHIEGRIQSRIYMKKTADGEIDHRVAYEVSASKVELMEVES